MKTEEIPAFVCEVMTQIKAGIQQFSDSEAIDGGVPKLAEYPEQVEIQLCIETHTTYDDGTVDGAFEVEHQQCWVKIPWPTKVG